LWQIACVVTAEQLRELFEDLEHIKLTVASQKVLIDRGILQQPEAGLVVAQHCEVCRCVTAGHVIAQDRSAS